MSRLTGTRSGRLPSGSLALVPRVGTRPSPHEPFRGGGSRRNVPEPTRALARWPARRFLRRQLDGHARTDPRGWLHKQPRTHPDLTPTHPPPRTQRQCRTTPLPSTRCLAGPGCFARDRPGQARPRRLPQRPRPSRGAHPSRVAPPPRPGRAARLLPGQALQPPTSCPDVRATAGRRGRALRPGGAAERSWHSFVTLL